MSALNRAAKPFPQLLVIDRLEVGPVQLERRRLVAPYTVHVGGQSDSFDFSYRYEADVFDPHDPADVNLGSLLAAQIALNYGLFCREIVFRGPFDPADRRFLEEMAKNTAREIYVKKFLEPNPFLTGPAANLPVVKRSSYLQARLLFPDAAAVERLPPWNTDRTRVAVLSSGGKESLLSYAVLREMGLEVHSVFVNESGRHWFTALNAYRHFKQHVPHTARVWTNSDRLFSWMVRHLSFIRPDFDRLRSDDYPLRLWTVAIFLFGVLPVLRRQGAARLVIGDEYDTTDKRTHEGIPHYNGLYDQSRQFDQALTRYFQRKGWGVSQFSLARPLSELLIEKVLIERYADIQRLQTSCHATHTADGRVLPCGRCEKCARVTSMLSALGGDPAACGYTESQIRQGIQLLTERGAAQERAALEQLGYLLQQRGLLPGGRIDGIKARRRPEVMKLRFDSTHSPIDDIPVDLRAPLYRILLGHAEGAARRSGRTWIDFDLLASSDIARPYRFEPLAPPPPADLQPTGADMTQPTTAPAAPPATPANSHLLGELTWREAYQRFQEVDVALLPVGAIEQHGPHLPLDTDAFDADCLCRQVALRCCDPKPLVLPLIPYGVSYHHDDFAGTVSIGPETLARLVQDVGMSVARHGVTKLLIINGHGGNGPALQFAAQLINRDAHIFTCVESGETSDADVEALAETPGDVHAGEIETSTSLANRPHLVQMDKAEAFIPRFSSHYLDFSSQRGVDWYARTEKISPTGVLGDPTKATREKGEKMWNLMIGHLVKFVEDLKSMTLDEIHQRSGL